MKAKIIKVMAYQPPYNLYWNTSRPGINWDTTDGHWVGIWDYEWADLIAKEVLKITDDFDYEVWQPDLKADKIYSHEFPNGLIHRLFPAESWVNRCGLTADRYISSRCMVNTLVTEFREREIILHVNGLKHGVSRDIMRMALGRPCLLEFLGEATLPLNTLFKLRKNILAKFCEVKEHFVIKKILNNVQAICCCNQRSINNLRRYYSGEVLLIPVGTDFDYWARRADKTMIRKSLGIPTGTFIILSSSRFNDLKQIDKMIYVLDKIDDCDFLYIVTGHGDPSYERYLYSIGESLIEKGKLRFVGYLAEKELRDYYSAADLFVITSLSEGAPDAAKKALAMELPVFTTDTGFIAELLRKHEVGVVVPLRDYSAWERNMRAILHGHSVPLLNRDLAASLLHWPNVAKQYVDIYRKLYRGYYVPV